MSLRPLTATDWPDWVRLDAEAFGRAVPPHRAELYLGVTGLDRSLDVFDTAGSWASPPCAA